MRRFTWLRAVCIVLVLCLLSGCSAIGLDVETQLMPPESSGEHKAIRTALDAYITKNTKAGQSADYTLKYPSGGNYLSAFIMLDQVKEHTFLGDTETETAVEAVAAESRSVLAFYRRNDENALVHINLLQSDANGNWKSVADVEGKGESVNQVEFGDLNNDGTPELLIGWSLYNSRDSRLSIYDISSKLALRSFSGTYTQLVVSDLTADGADDLLLLSVTDVYNVVSAQLCSFAGDTLITDSVILDGNIIKFGDSTAVRLSENGNGLFVDCYQEQNAMITELVIWKGKHLVAPLRDRWSALNVGTARELPIPSRDIDGDGAVEWPFTTRVEGFETTPVSETLWLSEWCSYDFEKKAVQTEFFALVPANDGYMFRMSEEWLSLPVSYDAAARELTVYGKKGWLFRIATFSVKDDVTLPEGYEWFEEKNTLRYAVSFSQEEDTISLEELRYLFGFLE